MGIEVVPKERDLNDISRLEIKYSKGIFETPNRFVNRNDLNSKNGLGIDIGITLKRNLFINEFKFNLETFKSIKNNNTYLSKVIRELENYFNRVDNSNAFKALYFKLTKDIIYEIKRNQKIKSEIIEFIIDIINNLQVNIDLYLFNVEILPQSDLDYFEKSEKSNLLGFLRKNDLQYSPIISIKDYMAVKKYTLMYLKKSSLVPFISYTYSIYTTARNSYRFIKDSLEHIHENNKGILTINTPRLVDNRIDVSGVHYSSFIISDIISEKFIGAFKSVNDSYTKFRLFDKNNLNLPLLEELDKDPEEYWSDLSSEITDKKIKDLYDRIIKKTPTEEDFKNHRISYLSRIQENIVSTIEFTEMRKYIKNNNLKEYRESKNKMNYLLKSQKL